MSSLENATFYIINGDDFTIGTGFLIAPTLGVTCLPVRMRIKQPMRLKFNQRPEIFAAEIEATSSGLFVNPDYEIVYLRLQSSPDGITPLSLAKVRDAQLNNTPFLLFTDPGPDAKFGIHANGHIFEISQRPHWLRLQIDNYSGSEHLLGSPIWDEKREAVIGIALNIYSFAPGNPSNPAPPDKIDSLIFALPSEAIRHFSPDRVPIID